MKAFLGSLYFCRCHSQSKIREIEPDKESAQIRSEFDVVKNHNIPRKRLRLGPKILPDLKICVVTLMEIGGGFINSKAFVVLETTNHRSENQISRGDCELGAVKAISILGVFPGVYAHVQ